MKIFLILFVILALVGGALTIIGAKVGTHETVFQIDNHVVTIREVDATLIVDGEEVSGDTTNDNLALTYTGLGMLGASLICLLIFGQTRGDSFQ